MKPDVRFTDAELRTLWSAIQRGEEPASTLDLLRDDEAVRLDVLSDPLHSERGVGMPTQPPTRTGARGFVGGLAEMTLPAQSLQEADALLKTYGPDPMGLLSDMAGGIVQQTKAHAGQAWDALARGDVTEAAGQAGAAMPLVGPLAREVGESVGSGEYMRALGQLVGLVAPGALIGRAGRGTKVAAQEAKAAALREQAKKAVTQALDPRKEKFKADTARIAEEVARRRDIGGTLEAVKEGATAAAEKAGRQIGDFWETRGDVPIQSGRIVGELELSKQPYQAIIKDAAGNPINVIDRDARAVQHLTELQQLIEAHGDTISAQNARGLMHTWAEPVAQAGGFSHRTPGSAFVTDLGAQTELWAKREGVDAIRQVLAESHPSIVDLNKEFTFQRRLRDITASTLARTSSHRSRGLGARVAGAAGAPTGAAVGAAVGSAAGPLGMAAGAGIGSIVGHEAAARLSQVFNGPRWKLFSAHRKMRLADAVASGHPERIRGAVGKAIAWDQALAQRQ